MPSQSAALLSNAGDETGLDLLDCSPGATDFLAAVIDGLGLAEKRLPCRFLYDAAGSRLFDRICELPEYYPTRTEATILRDHAAEIAAYAGAQAQLVELGSGSSTKVRLLLDAFERPGAYVPIDISRDHLMDAAQAIRADYPDIRVQPVCADYHQAFELPSVLAGRRIGFYPGSTIGNLTPGEARDFLELWSRRLGAGALLLVGVDLQKSRSVLEAAYDDAQGVTAAFTLNILRRINRELNADFDLSQFKHHARYLNEGRVAIHLRAKSQQQVKVGQHTFQIGAGEMIHVEDSWKYTLKSFTTLAASAGFHSVNHWRDQGELFSVHLLKAAG